MKLNFPRLLVYFRFLLYQVLSSSALLTGFRLAPFDAMVSVDGRKLEELPDLMNVILV